MLASSNTAVLVGRCGEKQKEVRVVMALGGRVPIWTNES